MYTAPWCYKWTCKIGMGWISGWGDEVYRAPYGADNVYAQNTVHTETKDWAIFRMMKFLSVKCSNTYNQHGDDADADADETHLRRSFICQCHRPSFTIF